MLMVAVGAGVLHPGSSEKGRSTGPLIGVAHVGAAVIGAGGGGATFGVQFQSEVLSDRGMEVGGTELGLADLDTAGNR